MAKQRVNVTEINSVVAERKRRESRERRLGSWERGWKTMILGIIGVALVSFFGSGRKHRSLLKVFPTAVGEGVRHSSAVSFVEQPVRYARKLRQSPLCGSRYYPINVRQVQLPLSGSLAGKMSASRRRCFCALLSVVHVVCLRCIKWS